MADDTVDSTIRPRSALVSVVLPLILRCPDSAVPRCVRTLPASLDVPREVDR